MRNVSSAKRSKRDDLPTLEFPISRSLMLSGDVEDDSDAMVEVRRKVGSGWDRNSGEHEQGGRGQESDVNKQGQALVVSRGLTSDDSASFARLFRSVVCGELLSHRHVSTRLSERCVKL